jgi:hypothetical protein
MENLLGLPTVLELEGIGDDEEKSFVIGLLLMRLYEFRRAHGGHKHLQHVLVVEEAHRLLKRTSAEGGSSESANPAAKAVETFTNMLAEIRSYGQGFMIADQIPNKLAVEVIKNTNLKLMHRVVAEDDRAVMGGAMNLDEYQQRHTCTLTVGQTLVFGEGAGQPFLVQVDFDKSKQVSPPDTREESDGLARRAMSEFRRGRVYDRFEACASCPVRCDSAICELATQIRDSAENRRRLQSYLLGAVWDHESVFRGYFPLSRHIERIVGKQLRADGLQNLMYCLLVHSMDLWLEMRGRHYRWLYNVTVDLKARLGQALLRVPHGIRNDVATISRLKREVFPPLTRVRQALEQLCQMSTGPFLGCRECSHRCLLAPEVGELAGDDGWYRRFKKGIDAENPLQGIRQVSNMAARELLPAVNKQSQVAAALCYMVQSLNRLRAPDAAELIRDIFKSK